MTSAPKPIEDEVAPEQGSEAGPADAAESGDGASQAKTPPPGKPQGRPAPGQKEVPPFQWKLVGYSQGIPLTLFKSVEKEDAEAHLTRYTKEGFYEGLAIHPIEKKIPVPKGLIIAPHDKPKVVPKKKPAAKSAKTKAKKKVAKKATKAAAKKKSASKKTAKAKKSAKKKTKSAAKAKPAPKKKSASSAKKSKKASPKKKSKAAKKKTVAKKKTAKRK